MTGFSGADGRAANRERAAMIKRRVGVDDALDACGLATDLGFECPVCNAIGTIADEPVNTGPGLKGKRVSDSATCSSCETLFDAISVVRAAKGFSFNGACTFLERECLGPAAKDDRTGRLF